MAAISSHPDFSYEKLAETCLLSRPTIARTIKALQSREVIRRIGSDKKGHWQIIDKYVITCSVSQLIVRECSCVKAKPVPKPKTKFEKCSCNSPKESYESTKKNQILYTLEPETDLESGLSMDKPFKDILLGYLIESGKSNSEVYNKGGISRQVFSNIFTKKDFIPKKDTVICIIIGLELPYNQAIRLLECAGYTLSRSIVLDTVVMKYFKRGIYDLFEINAELDERGCPLLGWKPRDN